MQVLSNSSSATSRQNCLVCPDVYTLRWARLGFALIVCLQRLDPTTWMGSLAQPWFWVNSWQTDNENKANVAILAFALAFLCGWSYLA